jgi:Tat protein secretion system quality control protein TatD with DNase activity
MHPMLNTAVKAARRAGHIIGRASLDLGQLKVGIKQQNDFVTEVDRAAEAAIIEILREVYPSHAILAEEMGKGAVPALIHCLPASADFSEKVLAQGLAISLSGIVTFKNAKDLQKVAKTIRHDKLLVEPDSPFGAPVPHGGRVCEPAYVADTAAFVAGLRGMDVEHLKAASTANFFNLFSKASL